MSLAFPPRPGDLSPWGDIQTVTPLGPDAVSVTTASHGGICVSPAALRRIPEPLRLTAFSAGGWFEEDCDWAVPYLALGLQAFEGDRGAAIRRAAVRTVRRWHPAHAEALGVGPAQDASDGPDKGRAEVGKRKGGTG